MKAEQRARRGARYARRAYRLLRLMGKVAVALIENSICEVIHLAPTLLR